MSNHDPDGIRIEFREAKKDGIATFWHVEAYSPEGNMFPVGTAYVVEVRKVASLSFIFVADQWRRQGYGRAMIEAIRNRWPDFQSSTPIDNDVAMKFAIATRSPVLENDDGELAVAGMNRPTASITTLLEVAASTSSVLPWGVAVLASIERIVLWDTRHDASIAIVEAIASEEGAVVESGAVDSMAGSAVGVMITAPNNSPSLEDLETIAGQLRFRYLMATRPEQNDNEEPF